MHAKESAYGGKVSLFRQYTRMMVLVLSHTRRAYNSQLEPGSALDNREMAVLKRNGDSFYTRPQGRVILNPQEVKSQMTGATVDSGSDSMESGVKRRA